MYCVVNLVENILGVEVDNYLHIFQTLGLSGKGMLILNHGGRYSCWKVGCDKEYDSSFSLLIHQYENGHLGLVCCVCDKRFASKKTLRRHVKSMHLQEEYVCAQCPDERIFNRKDRCRNHQLKVHGLVLCEICCEGFTDLKLLTEHTFTHR